VKDRYRVFLAMLLSIAVLVAWPFVMHRFFPTPPEPTPTPEEQTTERQVTPPPPPTAPATQTLARTVPTKPTPAQITAQVAEREIVIESDYWTARLSNRGAVVTSWVIHSYPRDGEKRAIRPAEGDLLELIPKDLPEGVSKPFAVRLPWSPDFAEQLNHATFQVEGAGLESNKIKLSEPLHITFTYVSAAGTAHKTFTFSPESFIVDVNVGVTVRGSPQPVEVVLGPRIGDQSDKQTGSYSVPPQVIAFTREGKRQQFIGSKITPAFATVTGVDYATRTIVLDKPLASDVDSVKLVADKGATLLGYARVIEASPDRHSLTLERIPSGVGNGTGVAQGTDTLRQGYRWAGVADHYFSMLAVGDQISEIALTSFEEKTDEAGKVLRDYPSVAVPVAAGAPLHVFVGPKDHDLLASAGQQLHTNLTDLIDWGLFSFAVRPLIPVLAWALKGLAKAFGNYGWAIVAVTVIINLCLSPLRFYSSKKMKNAARHQPRLKELQDRMKKLKENPKKNERELMQLQQEQLAIMKQANPLGGCMPLVLQMPIFWAVYLYLGSSLDVRHEKWMLWIADLSKPDRLYILPIVMCVTMIASTQLTPQPPSADPSMKMQRVMMTWLMPIMLTWFFFFSAPSGLVLYWMVSNVIGVLIQLVINKKTAHLTAELQGGGGKNAGLPQPKDGKGSRRSTGLRQKMSDS